MNEEKQVTAYTPPKWTFIENASSEVRIDGNPAELLCNGWLRKTSEKRPAIHIAHIAMCRKADVKLMELSPELADALQEAVSEECSNHACDPCEFSNEDYTECRNEPGRCFVQRWISLLAEARGNRGQSSIKEAKMYNQNYELLYQGNWNDISTVFETLRKGGIENKEIRVKEGSNNWWQLYILKDRALEASKKLDLVKEEP